VENANSPFPKQERSFRNFTPYGRIPNLLSEATNHIPDIDGSLSPCVYAKNSQWGSKFSELLCGVKNANIDPVVPRMQSFAIVEMTEMWS
jgi:hypothetical protein